MNRKKISFAAVGLIALAMGVSWWWFASPPSPRQEAESQQHDSRGNPDLHLPAGAQSPGPAANITGKSEAGVPGRSSAPDPQVTKVILSILARFRQQPGEELARQLLQELRDGIRAAPGEAAAAAILAFLDSGEDAATGLPFLAGPEGVLETAPTMRTALMDLLPALDPHSSVEVARETMDRRTSQDEYALGLRNLAWNDYKGDMREELAIRFSSMLDVNEWLANPSAGFLESFDIAVELGTGRTFDDVTSVIRLETQDGQPATNGVERASFIAADRMVYRNPGLLVDKFAKDPNFLSFAPGHRASLMSRLDITNPAQRDIFVNYLQMSGHGDKELDYFSELFPNGNYFYGHRLVTADERTPSVVERQAMDRQVLRQIDALLLSAAPGPPHATLARIRERLVEFTAPAPP